MQADEQAWVARTGSDILCQQTVDKGPDAFFTEEKFHCTQHRMQACKMQQCSTCTDFKPCDRLRGYPVCPLQTPHKGLRCGNRCTNNDDINCSSRATTTTASHQIQMPSSEPSAVLSPPGVHFRCVMRICIDHAWARPEGCQCLLFACAAAAGTGAFALHQPALPCPALPVACSSLTGNSPIHLHALASAAWLGRLSQCTWAFLPCPLGRTQAP